MESVLNQAFDTNMHFNSGIVKGSFTTERTIIDPHEQPEHLLKKDINCPQTFNYVNNISPRHDKMLKMRASLLAN